MAFRLLLVGGGENDFAYIDGALAEFETADEAQQFAARLSAEGAGTKWRIKRVIDKQWRHREQRKFENGHYQYVPWFRDNFWSDPRAIAIHQNHFPHPSKKEPGMLAFTESEEQGMDNRKTRIKPGRYLERFFADLMKEYGRSVKKFAEDFAAQYEPRVLQIAKTKDEVQWVYEHGPNSCMSSRKYREKHGWGYLEPGKWPLDMHACRIYIFEDLEVAYITENDKPKGRVVARSVIWPAKKTHSRCYGDEVRMKGALWANGYKFGPPIGAKVERVPVDGHFVMPYVDMGDRSGTGAMGFLDRKTHLELVKPVAGARAANNTSGLSGRRYGASLEPVEEIVENCQHCNIPVNETEDGSIYRIYRSGSNADRLYWCESCRDSHAFYCSGSDRYFVNQVDRVTMANGDIWSAITFRTHGFRCAGSGENHNISDLIVMYDGSRWCSRYFEHNGFQCEYTGDYYPNSQRVELADGHVISKMVLNSRGFKCRTCEKNFMNSQRRGDICVTCAEPAASGRSTSTEERPYDPM